MCEMAFTVLLIMVKVDLLINLSQSVQAFLISSQRNFSSVIWGLGMLLFSNAMGHLFESHLAAAPSAPCSTCRPPSNFVRRHCLDLAAVTEVAGGLPHRTAPQLHRTNAEQETKQSCDDVSQAAAPCTACT